MQLTPSYNLLDEKWIPVLYGNGKTEYVGIYKVLIDAHRIRQIATSNPMDRVALSRFLLAVLMWCKEDAKTSLTDSNQQNNGVTAEWLMKLKDNENAFNLLGDGPRFYQNASVKNNNSRPVADLLVEFPGADSVNHMRHVVHDGSYGFCPACCALGILRFSVWAPANRYYPASINPGSAAYIFRERKNLLQILQANLPETNTQGNQAPWLDNEQPKLPDAVAKLAWRPRKLWLNIGSNAGTCANCGSSGTLIKTLHIEKGWNTPVTEGQKFGKYVLDEFQQLHVEYKSKQTGRRKLANKVVKIAPVILKCRMLALSQADSNANQAPENESPAAKIARVFEQLYAEDNEEKTKELTRKPTREEQPLLDQDDTQAKKFWVEDPHLLKEAEAISLPDLSKDVAMHASKFWRDAMRLCGNKSIAIGIVGDGQYVFHDAPTVRLPEASDDVQSRTNLSAECSGELCGLLKQITKNPARQHPEIDAVKLLTPDAEAKIRDRLSQLGDTTIENDVFLRDVYAPMVEQVIASITPGSTLNRIDAKHHAQAILNKKIRELVEKQNKSANPGTNDPAPNKPKRSSRKGGSR